MNRPVHVLGGAQTDFALKWADRGVSPLHAMLSSAVEDCLTTTGIDASDIPSIHVANFAAEQFAGQSHLGSMAAMLSDDWSAVAASRHEAACASGSVAILAAAAEIEAGRYDAVLVVGVEYMRGVPGAEAARKLSSATWTPTEVSDDALPWPAAFDAIAEEVDRRHGLDPQHLDRIAAINLENARHNPLAQTRSWTFSPDDFGDESKNPVVAGRIRKSDCGRITDGACAVVLVSDDFLTRLGTRPSSTIAGWGHRVAPLPLQTKLDRSRNDPYLFPHLRRAITDAYDRAAVRGPDDLDVIETHDCFTINEYIALEHFGMTEPGHAWEAIDDGRITREGDLPVNPSGGLIGAGHPVGATGVRMVLDAHRQVTGEAGDYQVAGARTAATLNIGGSCSSVVSFILTDEGRVNP